MLLNTLDLKNIKIAKYIRKNLLIFFFAIFFVIGLVVFGNQFVLTVQESVERGIPLQELMPLVSFNMIRDIPLIFVLSFFLAIIITISQLYKNSEAIAMNSFGIGDFSFFSFIRALIIFGFFFVFFLTMFAVPWAKYHKNIVEDETKNSSEFSFITEGRFETFKNGEIVFYASESNSVDNLDEQNMEEIFIYANEEGKPVIVLAPEATKYTNSETKSVYLRLKDGVRYEGLPGSENINILNFDSYDIEIISGEAQKTIANFSKIEEMSSLDLIKNGELTANAEIQWRLSQPISIVILSFFGIFLGKTSPRGGKGINILVGLIIFMLYNNALLVAKKSIENGQLDPLIGMWSIHLFAIIIILILYQFRQGKIRYFIAKMATLNFKEKNNVYLTK